MNAIKVIFLATSLAALAGCTLDVEDGCNDPDHCGWYEGPDAGVAWWTDASPLPWDGGGGGLTDAMPIPPDGGGGGLTDAMPIPPDGAVVPPDDGGGIATDCSSVTVEAVCVVLAECEALYAGVDCSCDSDGACSCAWWEFAECR